MSNDTARGRLLAEAAVLIEGDRNKSYGSPTQNFTNIAALWNVLFEPLLAEGKLFEPHHVAEAMIALKLARGMASVKRDTFLDIAGYAACGFESTGLAESTTAPEPERERAFAPRNRTQVDQAGLNISGL